MKPTTTLQTQANTGKHRQFHPFPIKNSWGFIGNGQNVSFCVAPPTALLTAPPTALPTTTTTPGPPPWPAYFSPAANNNDAARHPSLPCRHRRHFNSTTMPGILQNHRAATAPAALPRRRRRISRPHSIAAPPSPNSHSAGQTQPVSPSNRTRPATSTQSRHLVISSAGAQNPCGLCLLSPAARLRVGDGFQSQPMSRRQRGRQLPRAPR